MFVPSMRISRVGSSRRGEWRSPSLYTCAMPGFSGGGVKVLDTTLPGDAEEAEPAQVKAGQAFPVEGRSVVLLRRV